MASSQALVARILSQHGIEDDQIAEQVSRAVDGAWAARIRWTMDALPTMSGLRTSLIRIMEDGPVTWP